MPRGMRFAASAGGGGDGRIPGQGGDKVGRAESGVRKPDLPAGIRCRTPAGRCLNGQALGDQAPSLIFSVSSGMNSSTLATIPTSATWKIGALGFLLMATMKGLPLMPPMCWKEPLMPQAR